MEDCKETDFISNLSLNDLPDCILIEIFQYLDSTTLYIVSKVNTRLERLILDKCFWKQIEARRKPDSVEKTDYILERILPTTSKVCFRAFMKQIDGKYMNSGLGNVNIAQNLTILALENQIIEATKKFNLKSFPKTLEELSFRRSVIKESRTFFHRSSASVPNLRVLMLDDCYWICSEIIMSVSKFSKLEVLSLYKCHMEASIPYFSLAAWHGFQNLKVLDVRFTCLGDSLLSSTVRCRSIPAFYFQDYDSSKKGTNIHSDSLTDESVMSYRNYVSNNKPYVPPKSYLYTEPYQHVCQCGSKNQNGDEPGPSWKRKKYDDSDDSDDDETKEKYRNDLRSVSSVIPTQRMIIGLSSQNDRFEISSMDRVRVVFNRNFSANGCEHSVNENNDVNVDNQQNNEAPIEESTENRKRSMPENCGDEPPQKVIITSREIGEGSRQDNPVVENLDIQQNNDELENNQENPGPQINQVNLEPWVHIERIDIDLQNRMGFGRQIGFCRGLVPRIRLFANPYNPNEQAENNGNNKDLEEIAIKRLSFRGFTGITDLTLRYIEHLNLELIDLTDTCVTKKGIDRFLTVNPDCIVVHKDFCLCVPRNSKFHPV